MICVMNDYYWDVFTLFHKMTYKNSVFIVVVILLILLFMLDLGENN